MTDASKPIHNPYLGDVRLYEPRLRRTAEEMEKDLNSFVYGFFIPIVRDLEIESFEETPLCIGFHLFGVHEMDQKRVAERLREAMDNMSPSTTDDCIFPPPGIELWNRLRRLKVAMTAHDMYDLRHWFLRLSKETDALGLYPLQDWRPPSPYAYIEKTQLSLFHKILDGARKARLRVEDGQLELPSTPAPQRPPVDAAPRTTPSAVLAVGASVATIAFRILDSGQFEKARAALWCDSFDIVGTLSSKAQGDAKLGLVFDDLREGASVKAVFVDSARLEGRDIWFVGDIHGDFLGLEASLDAIHQKSEDPTIIFLGDFIDRGNATPEVLLRIFQLMLEKPDRICLLAGNHSDGLGTIEGDLFHSSVSPSDFVDLLNRKEGNPLWRMFGDLTLKIAGMLPRALFFPDGLLVAHGGIPHRDLHGLIQSRADLNSDACLQDFVWTRAHPSAPRKLPNRHSRGCEFGVEDFNDFCQLMADRVGFPVKRMVRGHTHEEQRFAIYDHYVLNPMVTINNMCHRMPGEFLGSYERTPCIARWRAGLLPEVHRVLIDPGLLNAVCPPLPEDA